MNSKAKKIFVLVGGWLRDEKTYEKLKQTSPKDVEFFFIPYKHIKHPDSGELLNLINRFSSQKINLIGHSVGGAIAIEYSIKHPDKVDQLYLVDSEGIYGNENVKQILHNLIKSNVTSKKFLHNLRSVMEILKNPLIHTSFAKYAHFSDLNLENLSVPTTILWGDKDILTPLWQGEKLKELIKTSKLHVLKGYDHDWLFSHPEKFWEFVKNR